MYVEEKRKGINWGGLIKNSLIIIGIVLVIFLVIWLFTRNRSNAIDVNYDNNNNTNETLINPDYYTEEFINNYRYFHDTAKEYFLISELPEDGKSLKLTLKQLIDKNLVLPFGYQGGACDTEKSYVLVNNDNGYYTMTTNLVCGKEIAQTNEELGCNQLCENGKCDNKELITEYQFKQAYQANETTYSCPTGYTKTGSGSNTKCIKSNEEILNATKNVTYSCPEGYTKSGNGENTTCTKGATSTIDATKNVTYSCPEGYTKSGAGENTKCSKISNESINANREISYSCPTGYVKLGSKCYKTSSSSIAANMVYTYSCPAGYTRSGSGENTTCTKTTTSTVSASPSHEYKCTKGKLVDNNKCRITTTVSADPIVKSISSCSSGYDKIDGKCVKYIQTDINHGSEYNGCTGGHAVVNPCSSGNCTTVKYQYKCTKGISSLKTYDCPTGYTKSGSGENTKCTKTTTTKVDAQYNVSYSCHEAYTMTGSGESAKCTRTVTRTADAERQPFYYCSEGYTISGSKCYKTTSTSIDATENITYSCPTNYVKSGDKCYKTTENNTEATRTTTYSCPENYTKDGNKCTLNNKTTQNAIKYVNYVCKDGYNKTGNGSNSVCTKGNTTSVAATASTKKVTKYKYKWSTETSLKGWTKTGKTRQVEKN